MIIEASFNLEANMSQIASIQLKRLRAYKALGLNEYVWTQSICQDVFQLILSCALNMFTHFFLPIKLSSLTRKTIFN